MNKLTETEVKLYEPDLDQVAVRLTELGAVLKTGRVFERNLRYDTSAGDLAARHVVLRLREDTRVRLTYKDTAILKDGIISREEIETVVDDFDNMDLILQRLGFEPAVIYEKYRTTYQLGEAEVVLDELPYGTFIEIEGPPPDIESALVVLNLQARPRIPMSYLMLFNLVKRALRLECHDLTFANFEQVEVPPVLFRTL